VFFGVRLNWYSEIISTFTRYQGTKRYQASLVMFVDIWDFFPLSSLFSASETFFPRGSCAHAKKMRRYKRKRKEILEVWDFSARLRKLKIIFQVYQACSTGKYWGRNFPLFLSFSNYIFKWGVCYFHRGRHVKKGKGTRKMGVVSFCSFFYFYFFIFLSIFFILKNSNFFSFLAKTLQLNQSMTVFLIMNWEKTRKIPL